MALILGGAGALLYRWIWKGKGRCSGCDNAGCPRRTLGLAVPLLGCLVAPGSSSAATEPGAPPPADPVRVSGEDLPGGVQRRYGAAASWSPREQVSITAEFLRVERESGDGHAATARLALEF